MLVELAVTDLGLIDGLRLVLGPGMTALTGETGAGKTMVVEAIELLVGGRADPVLVRPGATEAVVEGRFDDRGSEVVLTRVVPREGRSRAYVDGRMATAAALAEVGTRLVDLHGQHDHQSLLSAVVQRDALDRFGGIDLGPLAGAAAAVAGLDARLADLGGDAGARAREIDLLAFQVAELDAAGIDDPDEDERLDAEETALADAAGHRDDAAAATEALTGDGGAVDQLAAARAALGGRRPFAADEERLRSLEAELADVASEVRATGEAIEDDPAGLAWRRERRQLLVDLRRKYGTGAAGPSGRAGTGTLQDVIAYRVAAAARLRALEDHEHTAAGLERERAVAEARRADEAASVATARRAAAPRLAEAVSGHLGALGMKAAHVTVEVGGPGDRVRFLLAANPGAAPLPLARTASGGELARAMLALRLVLSAAPPTLVFDEVDAGIGGRAALSVGRALAELGASHQVLVVTHLPQVAAFADAQVTVVKSEQEGTTVARAEPLAGEDRVVELSRMLSGTPESGTARHHAAELLASAARERGR